MVLVEEKGDVRRFPLEGGQLIELHNTDCLAGMDLFSDKYFDVVVTSPPYNLGVAYREYDDTIPRNQDLAWLESIAIKIRQKMKDNGSFFLNIGAIPSST